MTNENNVNIKLNLFQESNYKEYVKYDYTQLIGKSTLHAKKNNR